MNWLDYVIIAILLLGTFSGIRKGLIKSVSNIVCIIVSIFVAKNYYKTVSVFLIQNTSIEEKIGKFLVDKNFAKNLLPMPGQESAVFSVSRSFASDMNSFLSVLIINAISVITIYLAVRFVLALLEGYLGTLAEVPGLREVNGLGGGIVGLVKSVIILMLIFTFITPVSAVKFFAPLGTGIESSVIAKYFYSYNFILGWIWSAALDFIK